MGGMLANTMPELNAEGNVLKTAHRQVKYLVSDFEADHGKLKQLIRPVRGSKVLKTAQCSDRGM